MAAAILIKDSQVAYSRLLGSVLGEVVVELPDDGFYTPYGYLVGINEMVNYIYNFLEVGPENFYTPYFISDNKVVPDTSPSAILIDHQANVYRLRLHFSAADSKQLPVLYAFPVRHGHGAKWALIDSASEQEKAMMAMRLSETLEEALELYTSHSKNMQHLYEIRDIDKIALELQEMGFTLPLPKEYVGKVAAPPPVTEVVKPD